MLDDTDTDPQTDPNANWTPPWATQPAASSAPSDMPAVPPEPAPTPDPSVTPQTGADLANVLTGGPQAPGGPSDQTAAANPPPVEIHTPDDYVGAAPYAGSSGVPAAAPFGDQSPPPNLQAPPLQAPGGAPGLQNLGQPAPMPAATPAVHDHRLAGLLPLDQMHALGLATDKTVDPSVRAAAWNALPANIRTETMLHAQGDQLDTLGGIYEHLSPQEQVAWQVANGNSEQMRTNTAIAKATTDYQSSIEKNHQWQQQQYQQIAARQAANDQRAQQLANTKVGVQFSPLSKVGIVLGSMLGGMAGTNGSNAFMDSLNKNIDRQVADQKANLENQWKGLNESNNILGQEFARTGNMAEAEYTYKQAAYGATLNTIKTEAQNYIPGGTTHAKLQATYDATVSQMQQAQQLHQQQQEEAVAKIAKGQGEALESVAKGRIEAIKGGIKPEAFYPKEWMNPMATGPGTPSFVTAKQARAQFPQLAALLGRMPDDAKIPLAGAFTGSAKDYDQIVKRAGEIAEGESKRIAADKATSGSQLRGVDNKPLTADGTPNGDPLVVPTPEDASKINGQLGAMQTYVDLARGMERALRSDPSVFDRSEWAKLQGMGGAATAAAIKGLGANVSKREEEAINDMGSMEFTKWKQVYGKDLTADQMGTFATGLSSLVSNQAKRITGYRGDTNKLIFDPGTLKPAEKTPEDKEIAKGAVDISKLSRGELTPENKAWDDNGRHRPPAMIDKSLPAIVQRGLTYGIPPTKLELFDAAFAKATSSEPNLVEKGTTYINEMIGGENPDGSKAEGAPTADERAYASHLLEQLIALNAQKQAAPDESGPSTSVARDSNSIIPRPPAPSPIPRPPAPSPSPITQPPWWTNR